MGNPVVIRFREFDANGDPLSGGKLYSYVAGTTTKKATYSDPDCTTPNTNPVILDSEGYADVWVPSGSYKFALYDADDVQRWVKDDIPTLGSASGSSSSDSGLSAWVTHDLVDGQAAADIEGETLDFAVYSSAEYRFEIIRGTTVIANGTFAIQNLNGTGRIAMGGILTEELNGVTLSLIQDGLVVQLQAALSSGPGDGTIKLSRRLVPA